MPLTDVEVRILGSLMEKESVTPDSYPLSLNALTAACNQISNRDPVMQLDENAVKFGVNSLRQQSLARAIQPSDSRVMKFQHLAGEKWDLEPDARAVLCVLMLRGPQTLGEIKGRTGRLADFAGLADVERAMNDLISRQLGVQLPRRPGQKEARYAHLLSGEPPAQPSADRSVDMRAQTPDKRLIDVSHTVEHGMVTYKGFPAPIICDWLSREASRTKYAHGTEFQIGKIEMIANTGTYVDSPFHRYEHGKDLSELPLESLADLKCLVVRVPAGVTSIDSIPLDAKRVAGCAVLFHTGWDRHWRTDGYFEGHPHLTERAAEWLVKAGARIVGIDSLNIDSTATGERPVHSLLLGNEIPIVEHMRGLSQAPDEGGRFTAVPVKVKGMGTFPVRAFVSVDPLG